MIDTVKIEGDGYLVNDIIHVPKDDGNRNYQEVKEWLISNEALPEFTPEELIAKMVKGGETLVTAYIQKEVTNFNDANGTAFADVHAMANYKDSDIYPHAKSCGDLWDWSVSVWMKARELQGEAVALSLSADDFLALLPKLGV